MPERGGVKRELTGPALGMLAVAVVLVVAFTVPLYRQIELKTLDLRFRSRPALEQSPLILHIDIDDSSIESWGRWPWPRKRHATLLAILKELGAGTVVFDVEFSEPSDEANDTAFAQTLSQTGFSVFPFLLTVNPSQTVEERRLEKDVRSSLEQRFDATAEAIAEKLGVPQKTFADRLVSLKTSVARRTAWRMLQETGTLSEEQLRERLLPEDNPNIDLLEEKLIPPAVDHALSVRRVYAKSAKLMGEDASSRGGLTGADEIRPPIYRLASGCVGFGASNTKPDEEDGVIRHVTLFFVKDGRLLPHLSLTSACRLLGASLDKVEVVPGAHVVLHPGNDPAGDDRPIAIPVDGHCRTIVNWPGTGKTPWQEYFDHVPYGSFLELDALRENIRHNESVLKDIYRDNDRFVGRKWSQLADKIEQLEQRSDRSEDQEKELAELKTQQRQVEGQIADFLKRNVERYGEAELKKLPPDEAKEIRSLVKTMKYYLDGIAWLREENKRLSAKEAELTARLDALVRGRMCLVGSTETASTDLKPTPIHSQLPGVAVHSALINAILKRRFIREAPVWASVTAIVFVGLAVSFIAGYPPTRWAALGTLAALVAWAAVAYVLFALWGWWVAMTGPVTAGFVSYAAITAYRQLTEERQKRHVRNTFQHYLSPSVVEEVLKDPKALKLGGERKELTVFFSDVAGFTPISEQMEAEELVPFLNEYLSEMSDVILSSKGYINKYVGDGIMAVFGAPLPDPKHAEAACQVALESQRRLKDFREKLISEKRPILRARIGINSGVMIVGNMGSRKLFDYTVMGDNVNVGSRLESASKHFGTEIIIGENTYNAVREAFETRPLGLVHVKGRSKPVGAYELLAENGNCPPLVAKILPHYEEGLAAYAEQRWEDAVGAFTECLKLNPQDGPSKSYLTRCNELRQRTHVEHWDGTFTLETK